MAHVILLCADTEARDMIDYWLKSASVKTFTATNGRQVSEMLGNRSSQLLITDRLLPPWPGLDPISILRANRPDLRIAFLDDGNPDTRRLAYALGATDFLPRPLTRVSLLEILTQCNTEDDG